MPPIRRWRIVALTIIFTITSFYYLTHQRDVLNYDYSAYISQTPINDGKIHWSKLPERYPVTSFIPLPTGKPAKIPAVQSKPPKESAKEKAERITRRDAVKESFEHSWKGYKDHAWLRDEVAPISGKYKDTFGGWAATLVDSLDTLWIMGLKDDFDMAVNAVKEIDFTTTEAKDINVFETTIRYMGGFLAAYDISGGKYPVLLAKAVEVGELLMCCFDTPNRMPISRWDWKIYGQGADQRAPPRMLVSELGSMSLEFTRLTQLTNDPKYYDAIARISNVLSLYQNSTKLPGLWPVSVDPALPGFDTDTLFTLGGMSDSLYEYFPKHYLILGGLEQQPKDLYEGFIEVAKSQLFFRVMNPENRKLMVSGDIRIISEPILVPRGQHLTCFAGGMVGLASQIFSRPQDLEIAEELTQGCIWAYDSFANGIAPEIFNVLPCPKNGPCDWDERVWFEALNRDYGDHLSGPKTDEEVMKRVRDTIRERRLPEGFMGVDDRRYILRPEAIESIFIMWRITGKREYQEAAWRMFQAVEKMSRTPIAAAAIWDVTIPLGEGGSAGKGKGTGDGDPGGVKLDSMESFWLAETLKYFYLCFEEWDVVSLDRWVLNTEAHPLRRMGS